MMLKVLFPPHCHCESQSGIWILEVVSGPITAGRVPAPDSCHYTSNICSDVGPVHKTPPAVATQLVVPTQLNDGPVRKLQLDTKVREDFTITAFPSLKVS